MRYGERTSDSIMVSEYCEEMIMTGRGNRYFEEVSMTRSGSEYCEEVSTI